MTPDIEPTAELHEGFSQPGATARPWTEVADVLSTSEMFRLAAMWKSKLDWPFEVADGAFRDLEGRLGLVFGVTPTKVLSFGKAPYSQTRHRFTA